MTSKNIDEKYKKKHTNKKIFLAVVGKTNRIKNTIDCY